MNKRVFLNNSETKYSIYSNGDCINTETNRLLKRKFNRTNGYESYTLSHKNKQYTRYVHRLIGEYFLRLDIDTKLQINHIDGNKVNNMLENLEVVDASGNMQHAVRTKLLKTKNVYQYNIDGTFVEKYGSAQQAKSKTNVSIKSISICAIEGGIGGGYVWSYSRLEPNDGVFKKSRMMKNVKVGQYDMQGSLIETYENLKSAYKAIDRKDNGAITRVCKGERKSHLNYKWKFIL